MRKIFALVMSSALYLFSVETTLAASHRNGFLVFSTHQEALAYYEIVEKTEIAPQKGRPARAVIAKEDPRYDRLQGYLDQIATGFRQVYPEKIKNLPNPYVILVEDPENNAYAYRADNGDYPYFFVVQTGLIESNGEGEVLGLIAHEVAHLLFKHLLAGAADEVRVPYFVNPGQPEPLGYRQKASPEMKQKVAAYVKAGQLTGFPFRELNNVPMGSPRGFSVPDLLPQLIGYILQSDQSENCKKAGDSYTAASQTMFGKVTAHDQNLNLTPSDLQKLGRATLEFDQAFSLCTQNKKVDLRTLLKNLLGATDISIDERYAKEDIALFDEARDVWSGIKALVARKHGEMRAFESEHPRETIRYYSFEEQADDASIRVLAALKKDPRGNLNFLKNALGKSAESCQAILDAKQVPFYGDLVDEHHSTCWRIYHSEEMVRSLGIE